MADINAWLTGAPVDDGDAPAEDAVFADEVIQDLPPLETAAQQAAAESLQPYRAQVLDAARALDAAALQSPDTALEVLEELLLDQLLAMPDELAAIVVGLDLHTLGQGQALGWWITGTLDDDGSLIGSWLYWANRAARGDEEVEEEPLDEDEDSEPASDLADELGFDADEE